MHIVAAHSSKRDLEWRTIALSCLPFAMHYHSSRDRTRQLPRMCSRTPLRHISDRATCRDRAHMCTHSSIRFRLARRARRVVHAYCVYYINKLYHLVQPSVYRLHLKGFRLRLLASHKTVSRSELHCPDNRACYERS